MCGLNIDTILNSMQNLNYDSLGAKGVRPYTFRSKMSNLDWLIEHTGANGADQLFVDLALKSDHFEAHDAGLEQKSREKFEQDLSPLTLTYPTSPASWQGYQTCRLVLLSKQACNVRMLNPFDTKRPVSLIHVRFTIEIC